MPRQPLTSEAILRDLQRAGVPLHVEPGWQYRGSATFNPRGLVVHHTADGPGEYPSLRIVRDGRRDLPGPLAQWGLGRSGKVYLIACGRANHAGSGGWRGLSGNTSVWGIEAESTGRGDWTAEQRRVYPILAAAISRRQPFGPEMVCAHREWTTRKPDPTGIDMPSFRHQVHMILAGAGPAPAPLPAPAPAPAPPPPPPPPRYEEEPMIWHIYNGWYLLDGGTLSHISDGAEPTMVKQARAQGVPIVNPTHQAFKNRLLAGTEARTQMAGLLVKELAPTLAAQQAALDRLVALAEQQASAA